MCLKETYNLFKEVYPERAINFLKFAKLKPCNVEIAEIHQSINASVEFMKISQWNLKEIVTDILVIIINEVCR